MQCIVSKNIYNLLFALIIDLLIIADKNIENIHHLSNNIVFYRTQIELI